MTFDAVLSVLGCFIVGFGILKTLSDVRSSLSGPCVNGQCFRRGADNIGGKSYDASICFFPIDAVYTWTNESDPVWQQSYREYFESANPGFILNNLSSYVQRTEVDSLRFSIRSLFEYASWVRHVYIVTNGQVPSWLNVQHPRVTVVPHSDIFVNKSHLPTFSPSAVMLNLHRIPGLSEYFIHFHGNQLLGAEVWPDDFVSRRGVQQVWRQAFLGGVA